MRTLVINLTRFGDLLQTQPVLSGLRVQGGHTALACLDTFQGATALLRDLDEVLVLPGAKLLRLLDQSWPRAVAALDVWSAEAGAWDRIINLTPTLSARVLTRCLSGRERLGFGLDKFGFGTYSGLWAAFLQAASTYRGCSPFNLTDLFARVSGLRPAPLVLKRPEQAARDKARSLLADLGRPAVAFQLGASQDYRRWPVSAFVRAGRVIYAQSGRCPVLLGSAAEAHLGREFASLADYPFLDLIGATNLETLAAVLIETELLLTNDTGTMHLSAGLGIPIAAIFLGTAQPFDTGPRLDGSLSLEPDMDCHPCSFGAKCPHDLACREHINPESVGEIIAAELHGNGWKIPAASGARAWQARCDAQGYMELFSLSGHDDTDRGRWIAIQRDVYRRFFDDGPSTLVGDPVQGPFWTELSEVLTRCSLLLTLLEEQARLLALRPVDAMRRKFLLNCQTLQDMLQQTPVLGVLGPMWKYQGAESRSMDEFVARCGQYRELIALFQSYILPA
jgi:ADP-heptose:LPS heptosyltransferase